MIEFLENLLLCISEREENARWDPSDEADVYFNDELRDQIKEQIKKLKGETS